MKSILISLLCALACISSVWAGGRPIQVNDSETVKGFCNNATNLVVVMCGYDTCPATNKLAPGFAHLAGKYPWITFLVANMSSCGEIADAFNVTKTPTVACVAHKKMVEHIQSTDEAVVEAGVLQAQADLSTVVEPQGTITVTDYYYYDYEDETTTPTPWTGGY